jgi:predicted aspartyl protease
MRWKDIKPMGTITVELELVNNADMIRAADGHLTPDKVRRVKVPAVVDAGAMISVLPEKTVAELGLPQSGEVEVRFADGRREKRKVVDNMHLTLMGRSMLMDAIVEPNRTDALLGVIVLERLDFLVDPVNSTLYPREKVVVAAVE